MKIQYFITFALIWLIILPSCSKYEEGPLLSLRSVDKRLNNRYKIKNIYINNENVVNSLRTDSIQENGIEFIYDKGSENYRGFNLYINLPVQQKELVIFSGYNWEDKNTKIRLYNLYVDKNFKPYLLSIDALLPFIDQEICYLKIKKLTLKELIYEIDFQEKKYRYELQNE